MSQDLFIFIGPPGSGKGSLSRLCIDKLGCVQLSTGNLCRKHIVEQTEIGKQIDFIIKSGKLISDSLITSMVDQWLDEVTGGSYAIILDGFPRTVPQAQSLYKLIQEKYRSLKVHVVKLIVSDKTAIDRICNRIVCENRDCQAVFSAQVEDMAISAMVCTQCSSSLGRRSDDERETIQHRLEIYRKHEQELLKFFEQQQKSLIEVDVEKPLPAVFESFKTHIDA